jgi:hypothetical protein
MEKESNSIFPSMPTEVPREDRYPQLTDNKIANWGKVREGCVEGILAIIPTLRQDELAQIMNKLNEYLKRSLGPEMDVELRRVWVEDGRLMAIKRYHYHNAHRCKPTLQESIAYVEKTCEGLVAHVRQTYPEDADEI